VAEEHEEIIDQEEEGNRHGLEKELWFLEDSSVYIGELANIQASWRDRLIDLYDDLWPHKERKLKIPTFVDLSNLKIHVQLEHEVDLEGIEAMFLGAIRKHEFNAMKGFDLHLYKARSIRQIVLTGNSIQSIWKGERRSSIVKLQAKSDEDRGYTYSPEDAGNTSSIRLERSSQSKGSMLNRARRNCF
jgi:hypothetical protein